MLKHRRTLTPFRPRNDLVLPLAVFLVLLLYTYGCIFQTPYPGFTFDFSSGEVEKLLIPATENLPLRVGDKVIQIDRIRVDTILSDRRVRLFAGLQPGQVVPLVVERDGESIQVNWTYAGPTPPAVRAKVFDMWWLAFVFWGFGTATLLFLRPKDSRWRLMTAFNYLTALWIAVGISSMWALWDSGILFRVILWIAIPVYLHLHWEFPVSLGRIPAWLTWAGYGLAGGLALVQYLAWIPGSTIYLAAGLAVAGCLGLLVAHALRQPAERRVLGVVTAAAVTALAPSGFYSLVRFIDSSALVGMYTLAALPILPAVYFYTVYRRQLGGLEIRANRLISLYLFLAGLGTLDLALLSLFALNHQAVLVGLGLPILTAILVVFIFPPFERWVERHLLGMPHPPTRLLETYTAQISSSLETRRLVQLLRDEILSSLMVRQSALLCYDDCGLEYFLYEQGVAEDFRLDPEEQEEFWQSAGVYRPPAPPDGWEEKGSWIRLALPMLVGPRRIGMWLLGRRDPDDFYTQLEIPTLQAIADQTAIALVNQAQSERLSLLYQADIDRQEAERHALALELHDGVLNQLAILSLTVDEHNEAFEAAYKAATSRIREIISGLRPTMLNYGLRTALDELADEAPAQVGGDLAILVELPPTDVRYPPQTELHLYRIVQEACQNALQHSRARTIRISGFLEPDCFQLVVSDDGIGFAHNEQFSLDMLLANMHFGLAGMIERAYLIGAQMEISSCPGCGTSVRVFGKVTA